MDISSSFPSIADTEPGVSTQEMTPTDSDELLADAVMSSIRPNVSSRASVSLSSESRSREPNPVFLSPAVETKKNTQLPQTPLFSPIAIQTAPAVASTPSVSETDSTAVLTTSNSRDNSSLAPPPPSASSLSSSIAELSFLPSFESTPKAQQSTISETPLPHADQIGLSTPTYHSTRLSAKFGSPLRHHQSPTWRYRQQFLASPPSLMGQRRFEESPITRTSMPQQLFGTPVSPQRPVIVVIQSPVDSKNIGETLQQALKGLTQ